MPGNTHRNTAVLRDALLSDVQLSHHLESRYQKRCQHALGRQHFGKHAVNAVAHGEPVFEGFDVNIGRLLFHGLRQNSVNQSNDRRIVLGIHKVAQIRNLIDELGEVDVRRQILRHLRRLILVALIGATEARLEGGFIDLLKRKLSASSASHLEQCLCIKLPDIAQC